ncbi:hypothetical protein niasHT_000076 [Heterodera trifolii]|uniref:Uncharacterized protein n=1 Tax=Heterodera trifolii TaxID=157864 RepID=A0ABD2LVM3_9BILA
MAKIVIAPYKKITTESGPSKKTLRQKQKRKNKAIRKKQPKKMFTTKAPHAPSALSGQQQQQQNAELGGDHHQQLHQNAILEGVGQQQQNADLGGDHHQQQQQNAVLGGVGQQQQNADLGGDHHQQQQQNAVLGGVGQQQQNADLGGDHHQQQQQNAVLGGVGQQQQNADLGGDHHQQQQQNAVLGGVGQQQQNADLGGDHHQQQQQNAILGGVGQQQQNADLGGDHHQQQQQNAVLGGVGQQQQNAELGGDHHQQLHQNAVLEGVGQQQQNAVLEGVGQQQQNADLGGDHHQQQQQNAVLEGVGQQQQNADLGGDHHQQQQQNAVLEGVGQQQQNAELEGEEEKFELKEIWACFTHPASQRKCYFVSWLRRTSLGTVGSWPLPPFSSRIQGKVYGLRTAELPLGRLYHGPSHHFPPGFKAKFTVFGLQNFPWDGWIMAPPTIFLPDSRQSLRSSDCRTSLGTVGSWPLPPFSSRIQGKVYGLRTAELPLGRLDHGPSHHFPPGFKAKFTVFGLQNFPWDDYAERQWILSEDCYGLEICVDFTRQAATEATLDALSGKPVPADHRALLANNQKFKKLHKKLALSATLQTSDGIMWMPRVPRAIKTEASQCIDAFVDEFMK